MENFQFITIILTMVGLAAAAYKFTQDKINRMDDIHRDDIQKFRESQERIDAKWERLFEKLAVR
jgi:hypothetical protein